MTGQRDTLAWLAVTLAPGIGPARVQRLRNALGTPSTWLETTTERLTEMGLTKAQQTALRNPDPERLNACLDWLEGPGHSLLTLDDSLYPPLLKSITDPPPVLFVTGHPEVLVQAQIAIVGSRNATVGGLEHARDFAETLAKVGFVVTSGLATGADASAHRGCLQAGGVTIAVTGTGPDRVYPARHQDLAREISLSGALITPFPPGTEVLPANFPIRNRIISGMSLGTLVIEAGLRSGSLITARLAAEQGREVFAIPGSVHNPLARGCHQLIREGASLVETAQEIVDGIAPLAENLAASLRLELGLDRSGPTRQAHGQHHTGNDPEYTRLLKAIGFDPTPVDEIIRRSRLTTAEVSSMLLILELEGRVQAHSGGRYSQTGHDGISKDRSE